MVFGKGPKKQALLRGRLDFILEEAQRLWAAEDISASLTDMGEANMFNSTGGVAITLSRFETRLNHAIGAGLALIDQNHTGRGGAWQESHNYLAARMDEVFADVTNSAVRNLYPALRDPRFKGQFEDHFRAMIDRQKVNINAHMEGVTALAPEHWTKRRPILADALKALLGAVAGYLVGQIPAFQFPQRETTPPPIAENPAKVAVEQRDAE